MAGNVAISPNLSGPKVAAIGLKLQQPGLDAALTLHLDAAARLEHELVLELFVDRPRHLDGIRQAARFHAAREVYRVAPQIVDVLALADHTRHHRAGVDAHAELHR